MDDIITRIDLENIRSISSAKLSVQGLSVLLGENGSGKSSVIEACELLRRIPGRSFFDDLYNIHSGHVGLVRQGQKRLKLGVRIESTGENFPPVEYELALSLQGQVLGVDSEQLRVFESGHNKPLVAIQRTSSKCLVFNQDTGKLEPFDKWSSSELVLPSLRTLNSLSPRQISAERMLTALERIEIHVPFDSRPAWLSRSQSQAMGMRDSVMLQPTQSLARQGLNLPNVYHQLRDRADWQETLELVRLGLGQDVESIQLPADPSGGRIGIGVKYRGMDQIIPSFYLSEGQLSYLAMVALRQLTATTQRSILCFDEPELHLHPGMIAMIMDFFAKMGKKHPVLLSTHSDVLLNHLEDPVKSAILCERKDGVARFLRPSAKALEPWLDEYRGLGRALSEGAGEIVFEAEH